MYSRAWSICKGRFRGRFVIICLYVDDLLVTRPNLDNIDEFKKIIEAEFEITDLGRLSYFLGMEFTYTTTGLVIHQRKYANDFLKRFNMMECNITRSPMEVNLKLMKDDSEKDADETKFKQIIGSIRFICNSRPDLAFCVGVISRFMSKPKESHMQATKRVLWYIKGSMDCGVLFPTRRKKTVEEITGYIYSDYGGDPIERKSASGYIFMLNYAPVS
ncbi:Retrovirus-related Pol polyprotein from transposon TNT 1-94 Protease [Vigna angularis]|uniref:Retrovirus-related Pol polyprotein from transposon TNT 1-94 Protease n=1 Tax=Phaseolus angularis TaxID=3914 RepID=A0A8T0JJT8_PHAAN|nr:Retrovirus-related Pol polyprotein from transposon TNT 1-94 Protease [Vigna angularis]